MEVTVHFHLLISSNMRIRKFSIFQKSSTELEIESYLRGRESGGLPIVPPYEVLLTSNTGAWAPHINEMRQD